jgi:tetratricopeptide (TPR) repeat protein
MHPVSYVVMLFGAILAVTGIVLFARMGTAGTSSVKMFGLEFQLGGSALVIFVVGTVLFLLPIIRRADFPQLTQSSLPSSSRVEESNSTIPSPSKSSAETPYSAADPSPVQAAEDPSALHWYLLATALWRGGEEGYVPAESALVFFSRALAIDPNGGEILRGRAMVYKQLGEYDKALKDVNKAISLVPTFAENYSTRGAVFFNMNQLRSACADWNRAFALGSEYSRGNVERFCNQ